jgi:hypothetical protein
MVWADRIPTAVSFSTQYRDNTATGKTAVNKDQGLMETRGLGEQAKLPVHSLSTQIRNDTL